MKKYVDICEYTEKIITKSLLTINQIVIAYKHVIWSYFHLI